MNDVPFTARSSFSNPSGMRKLHISSATLVGGLIAFVALPARAQTGTTDRPIVIPQVEVVATRFPEAPHDVPASIEIITGAQLRARGVTTLRDALSLAAGVAVASGGDGGPASAVPEFWGLREFDAFLLVVDDVPWGGALNPAVATASLRDVERIEILRGPAPVTYGATSFVGVVHIVHTAASERMKYLTASGGSFGTGSLSADFGINPDGKWKSRVSADLERQGFKDDRTEFARGHTLLRTANIDGDRKTWLSADVNVLRQDPASPHPRAGTSLSTAVPLDANYNPSNAFINQDRMAVSGGLQRSVFDGTLWGTTASYTHSANKIFRGFLVDVSNTPNNAAGFRENIDINDVYADTHLLFAEVSHVRFMAGADVLFAAGEANGATFTYSAPLAGTTAPGVPQPSVLDKDSEDERRFLGAYGSAEWRPVTRLTVSAGVRMNATSEKRGQGTESTHSRPSGSFGALVSLWEQDANHVRVFANYRDTFKPAAFDFGLVEDEGVLEPETSRSYESGIKLRALDGMIDVEATVFRMYFENLVTPTIVNNQPALINAGSTRFQGFELASDLRLSSALTARATYSFHDGTFVNFVQEFDGVPTQLGGNRFEMSARHLASAGLTFAPEFGVIAYGSINYSGDRYLNKRNSALASAFATIDAGLGYRLGEMELRLDGRNLSDRRDAVAESEFGDSQFYRTTARTLRAGIALRY